MDHSSGRFQRLFSLPIAAALSMEVLVAFSYAVTPSPAELQQARDWIESSLVQGAPYPFRFNYDGQSSEAVLPTWEKSQHDRLPDSGNAKFITTFRDPNLQLEVKLSVRRFEEFPAAEWVMYFKNISRTESPVLKDILPLWTAVPHPREGGAFDLRYALGSHNRSDDFQLQTTRMLTAGEGVNLSSYGGRSSDGCLPFFNLHHDQGGVMAAVGWTGDWSVRFHRASATSVNVVAGMPRTRIRLAPGEEIRSPAIMLLFWQGEDPMRGHNLQRALLRKHFSPIPENHPESMPLAASPHAVIPFEKTTEENLLAFIASLRDHQIPINTFWIDTGWFTMIENHWARSVGNFKPDPLRFPKGMKPVSDAAHAAGWRFLLWQEPERVMPGTWLHKNHPEWLISPPADLPFSVSYMVNDGFHLLDLGNRDAVDWLIEETSQLIDSAGVDVYRNDCNIYPSFYWQKEEDVDGAGIREIRYVMGLYRWLDELRSRHPKLLIDNCASGGRRIDFEMLRRSIVLWRSDVGLGNAVANQSITHGLAHWIPLWGGGGNPLNQYQFRSALGPACVVSAAALAEPDSLRACKPIAEQYRDIRQLTEGDFFPLIPCSLRDDAWVAWQYYREDLGEGLIQAFRRDQAVEASKTLLLSGLVAEHEYLVRNLDDDRWSRRYTGRELMDEGLTVELSSSPDAALYHFREATSRPTQPTHPE